MVEATTASPDMRSHVDRARIRRLMVFFALAYVAEGAGQTDGLISQPLNYYLKQVYHWTPVEITAYLTVLNLPWFIKPLYGAVSDFVPLFGYRRKAYLILANAFAAVGYVLLARTAEPSAMIGLLSLIAYGMAISSTLCGALLVENGQKFRLSGVFVNQQWLWFNVAAMASALIGGQLIEHLTPASAVHAAAILVGLIPFAVIFGSMTLVEEQRGSISLGTLKANFAGLSAALRHRDLWVIAAFLFFYYFSPGFATPLYFYMTDTLKFSQQYIGTLGAIAYAGWIVGGLVYRGFLEHLRSRTLLYISIVLGVLSTALFVSLSGEVSAAIANFSYGVSQMIMLVATLSLAADYCPKGSEGFAFAALISVTNIAVSLADNAGSYLYEHAFQAHLYPLILVSAAFTAVAFVLVPLLTLGNKPQGEPVLANGAEWIDPSQAARVSPPS
jgi:predicted MFS family arabinose efflux permease